MNLNPTGIAYRLFSVSLVLLFFASYMGNWAIGAGHGFLLLALVILIVVFAFDSIRAGRPISRIKMVKKGAYRQSLYCLWLLMAIYAVSIFWNWDSYPSPLGALKRIRYFLVPLLFLMVLRGLPPAERLRWFKWCIVFWLVSLILATVSGLIGTYSGYNPLLMKAPARSSQTSGLFANVMSFAYSLQFSFLLLSSILLNWKNPDLRFLKEIKGISVLVLLSFLLAGLGLYFSFARGAVLGTVAGLLAIVICRKSWTILALVITVGTVGAVYSFQKDSRYQEGFKNQGLRVIQWKAAGLTFLKNPAIGVGYRNFEQRCAELKKEFGMPPDSGKDNSEWFNNHAHNNYLEALASTGIVGGLGFIGFCLFWLHEMCRSSHARVFFLPVIVAFMVSGLFENTFTDSEVLNFLLLIYLASQLVLDWEEDKELTERGGMAEAGS